MNKRAYNYLPALSDESAQDLNNKGWSFSNIYSLESLRDIFLITQHISIKNLSTISEEVKKVKPDWEKRKVLEYLNALVNFNLIDSEYKVKKNIFYGSSINSPLSNKDILELEEIFFGYFRFREIAYWFINPQHNYEETLINSGKKQFIAASKPLYFCSVNSRYTNTFYRDDDDREFIVEESMTHLMRFWDVFLKWGVTLGVIDKFSLSKVELWQKKEKEISISYFKKPFKEFNLVSFVRFFFKSRHIRIPDLIYLIAKEKRYSVDDIKTFLVKEIKENKLLTFERTSEIFLIKGKTKPKSIQNATYLYPMIGNYYISHLIIRKT